MNQELDPEAPMGPPPEEMDDFLGTSSLGEAASMKLKTSKAVLGALVHRDGFLSQVLPLLKEEYFSDEHERTVFKVIKKFAEKYNRRPSLEALHLVIDRTAAAADHKAKAAIVVRDIAAGGRLQKASSEEFLLDHAQEWIRERAFYCTMAQVLEWSEDTTGKYRDQLSMAPELMEQALSVSIKRKMGVDLIDDASARWDRLHDECSRLATDIEILNYALHGGFKPKKMTVILAGTGVGKTLALIHLSNSFILQGKNVLYVTLEIEPDEVCQRAEARLLDMGTEEIHHLQKSVYLNMVAGLKAKIGSGTFKVEELASSVGNTKDIKRLIDEYGRQGIKFDALMVDYLGIMAPTVKMDRGNLYAVGKMIAEEVRGLGQQYGLSVFTASQLNRGSLGSMDPSLNGIADSIGIAYTADFAFVLTQDTQMAAVNQCKAIILKSRYRPIAQLSTFIMGIDVDKQKFYDAQAAPNSKNSKLPKEAAPRGSALVEVKGRGVAASLGFGSSFGGASGLEGFPI